MKVNLIADALGVSKSIVKVWSKEFGDYVSAGARGGTGEAREYTEHDLRVLTLVRDLRKQQVPYDAIRAELDKVRADNWQELPDAPALFAVTAEDASTPAPERARLMGEIIVIRAELDSVRAALDAEHAQVVDLQQRLSDKERELGRLEGRLLEVRPVDYWHRLIRTIILGAVVLVVVAVVVAVAVVLLLTVPR